MADPLTYEQMLHLVASFYKTDEAHIVETLNKYGIQYGDMGSLYGMIKNTPYGLVYNADGSVRSLTYNYAATVKNASQEAAQQINSNVQVAEKSQITIPIESEIAADTGKVTFSSGLKAVGTGAKSALNFTFKEVVPAVAAASVGITVGKTIDNALYKLNPDFWDEKGMSSLNPDTWNSITSGDDSTGARLFNMVYGLNPDDGTTQAYMDENALAYLATFMQTKGVFDQELEISQETQVGDITVPAGLNRTLLEIKDKKSIVPMAIHKSDNEPSYLSFNAADGTQVYVTTYTVTGKPFIYYILACKKGGAYHWGYSSGSLHNYTFDSKNASVSGNCTGFEINYYTPYITPVLRTNEFSNNEASAIGWALIYGTFHVARNIEGITNQTGATTPDLSGITNPDEALQKLKETYPELWNNAVSQDVAQPDGTIKHYVYVPVGFPHITGADDTQPTTGSQTQGNTKIDPKTDPQELIESLLKTLTKTITPTNTPNPPDVGGGNTPSVVPVSGSASSLYAIYNPTLAEINSFGAWLWSDNFIEQIKKLFSDPMQAIIGLHKVYATPATGGSQNIKVGYLDSGVSSRVVTNQYTTIDCGTVTLDEHFFNVFDYAPYTEVSLYLPFIGIVGLDVADVMRATIHIVYHVEVLSGACLAEVKVTRDSAGGTLYQYAGNAAVTLPISSGSYMGIVASVASIAGGIAGTIASGGAAAPMLINAAGSALNARTRVEHSGGFSGNAGAMGGKIPYLIISRPQTEIAENYQEYIGNPSNHTTTLSACSGYVQVKECHLENIPATQNELNQIESLLKGGVII